MEKNQEMLTNASFGKLVLNLCVPTIIIMLVMVVYNMADTFFIGQTGDPAKIAAISLCSPLFSVLSGLGTLFGNGGCTSVSIALGKRETEKIKSYTSLCCYSSLLIGILFLGIILSIIEPLCIALGADASTLGHTVGYLRIIALGAPFIMFSNVFTNLIRADGAAKASMTANLLGTFSNILLDAVFIMAFHWDVAGAAAATVLGNIFSCIYLIFYITKKQPAFSLRFKYLSLKKEIVVPVVTLGLPLACSTLLMSCSHIISNKLMMNYGTTALAAQGVAGKIGLLISMLAMGICMGFQPALSYSYGSKSYRRLYQLIRNIGILTVAVGTVLTVICFFTRRMIITAFIDNADVMAYGEVMVIASLVTGPFYGLYQLCQTFLQSTGKAGYATFLSVLDKGIVFIPVLLLLNYFFGAFGIAFTGCVTLVFSLGAGIVLSLRWKRQIDTVIVSQS